MGERTPSDAEVRVRVTTDLGTTFLLEAGAGTGRDWWKVGMGRSILMAPAAARRSPKKTSSVAVTATSESSRSGTDGRSCVSSAASWVRSADSGWEAPGVSS